MHGETAPLIQNPAEQMPGVHARCVLCARLLDPDAATDFDQLALDIRRLLGRRVSKGDLVRALIALAAADPTLRAQLLDELRTRTTT